MKLLFFSDLHCHNHQQFHTRLPSGLNSRFVDCLNVIRRIQDLVVEEHIEACIFCGDLFHSRTKLDIDVWSETWKAIADLSKRTALYLLKGNHDQSSRIGDVHALSAFSPVCDVVQSPVLYRLGNHAPVSVYFVPHIASKDMLLSALAQVEPCDILVLHQALKEALPGPTDAHREELSIDDLPMDKVKHHVVLGDIHKRQFLRSNIHYVGSPLQLTFGEAGAEKAFSLIDTSDWKVQTLPSSGPEFRVLQYDEDGLDPGGEDWSAHHPDSNFLKVVYHPRWKESILFTKERYPRIQLEEIKQDTSSVVRISQQATMDDAALLREYIAQVGCGDLDAEELLEEGLRELLREE